jgi:hypothetical protein
VFNPFLFVAYTVSGILYLEVLEEFLTCVLEEDVFNDMFFQQGGVPPHFHKEVTDF